MKHTTNLLFLTTIICIPLYLPAGVILLADVPDSLKKFIQKTQSEIDSYIQNNQACNNQPILFERSTWDPHITLAYITDRKLTMEQLNKAEPLLQAHLAGIAKKNSSIDMSASLNNMRLEIWEGKNPSTFKDVIYKNYVILVIKIDATPQLQALSCSFDETLQNHAITQERQFPFNPHITIGWLYDAQDIDAKPIAAQLKPIIERCLAEFKMTPKKFIINKFILAAGNTQKNFHFERETKTSSAAQPRRSHRAAHRGPLGLLDRLKEGIQLPNECPR